MPQDGDMCGRCQPPHAYREHKQKRKRAGVISGICLMASCPCEGFVPWTQKDEPKKLAEDISAKPKAADILDFI